MAATEKVKDPELGEESAPVGSEPPGRNKALPYLIAVPVIMTVIPGIIFLIVSVMDGNDCSNRKIACIHKCESSYAVAVIRFQSEKKGKVTCLADCEETHGVLCVRKAFAGTVFSILLLSGMACAFALNIVLPLFAEQDALSASGWVDKARSAYVEPITSEQELRAAEAKKTRFFWQDAYKQPTVVEFTCLSCGFVTELDEKWWKVRKGGLTPAVCGRCRSVMAGLK